MIANDEAESQEVITPQAGRFYRRGLALSGIELPASIEDVSVWKRALLFHFIYSVAGLVAGLVGIFGGVVLFFGGYAGSTKWAASLLGMRSEITDAAPGSILFVVGVFLILITRFDVSLRSGKASPKRK